MALQTVVDAGHGVRLFHPDRQSESMLAFIRGFDWCDRPDATVNVDVLSTESPYWGDTDAGDVARQLDEIRRCVRLVLSGAGPALGRFRGDIFIVYNG
jgi:hypothetical protein